MGCLPMFLQIPVFLGLFHTLKRLRPGSRRAVEDAVRLDRGAVRQRRRRDPVQGADLGALHVQRERTCPARGQQRHRQDRGRRAGRHHDRDHLPDQPPDDPQDRLVGRPAAADDPEADAVRHPLLAADLRWAVPDRRGHLLDHHEPVLARPAVLGAAQVPAAADGQERVRFEFAAAAAARVSSGARRRPRRTARAAGTRSASARAAARRPGAAGRTTARRGPNGKPNLAKGKKAEDAKPAVDGRSLAPRPGAKPVNRKKGGPARRPSSG